MRIHFMQFAAVKYDMSKYFFDDYSEFISNDTRKDRTGLSTTTSELLSKRHEAMLPASVVRNKTVLDLGCWIGASGQWVLAHGADHYTGVEIQSSLANTARSLLAVHWPKNKFEIIIDEIENYLDQCIAQNKKYDIVVFVGVIQVFINTYEILEKLSKVADTVVIDGTYPRARFAATGSYVEIVKRMPSSSANLKEHFVGTGIKITPAALDTFMDSLGFANKDGLLYPARSENSSSWTDSYNIGIPLIDIADSHVLLDEVARSNLVPRLPLRFLARYQKSQKQNNQTLQDVFQQGVTETTVVTGPSWEFDSAVARRFQSEALRHIPDYHRVIDLCRQCMEIVFDSKDIKIIDIGSATGYTVNYLRNHGYEYACGVEKSKSMIEQSYYSDEIIHSDTMPPGPWDVALANWTLHFVDKREEYLKSIYDAMSYNGMLILSDKMSHTPEIQGLYYCFKRDQGVDNEEIEKKKNSLVGVLTNQSLEWYMTTLSKIGFKDIQVINSRYMFNTIYARKFNWESC